LDLVCSDEGASFANPKQASDFDEEVTAVQLCYLTHILVVAAVNRTTNPLLAVKFLLADVVPVPALCGSPGFIGGTA
jgi:hypothetical protein